MTVVIWKQNNWLGLYEIIPGFIFGWLATVIVSRFSQPSVRPYVAKHQAVETELRKALA